MNWLAVAVASLFPLVSVSMLRLGRWLAAPGRERVEHDDGLAPSTAGPVVHIALVPERTDTFRANEKQFTETSSISTAARRTAWIAAGKCWDCGGRPISGEYRCLRCYSRN